jgi:restriction endonuclease S subunit
VSEAEVDTKEEIQMNKESWKMVKLGEVCEVISGQSPEGKYYNSTGQGKPFYQGKTEFGEKYIQEPVKWTTQITKLAEKEDILMSVRAPVGPTNIATQQVCIGRGLAAIRVNKKLIENEFMFLYFKFFEKNITGTRGAVFNNINREQIIKIPIPLPPLDVQKSVALALEQKLESVEKLKSALHEKLQALDAMPQAYLREVFG